LEFISKNEYIYSNIKKDILEGSLRSGERLVFSTLAKRYGVSTMPVRKAISRLSEEGLVELIPFVGAEVYKFDFYDLIDMTQVIIELEPLASRLAAMTISEGTLRELEDLVRKMEDAMEGENYGAYNVLNKKFHLTIDNCIKNKRLKELINSYNTKTHTAMVIYLNKKENLQISLREHREWLKALKARDSKLCARIAKKHNKTSTIAFIDSIFAFVVGSQHEAKGFYSYSISETFSGMGKEEILRILEGCKDIVREL